MWKLLNLKSMCLCTAVTSGFTCWCTTIHTFLPWHHNSFFSQQCPVISLSVSQGRWESQQDIFMPSQFHRTLPRPASSPSTYSTSPSSSPTPFGMTPPQNQEPEQGKPPPFPPFAFPLFPTMNSSLSLFLHTSFSYFPASSFLLSSSFPTGLSISTTCWSR